MGRGNAHHNIQHLQMPHCDTVADVHKRIAKPNQRPFTNGLPDIGNPFSNIAVSSLTLLSC